MFQSISPNKCHEKNLKIFKHWLPYCYVQIIYFIQFFILPCVLDFCGKLNSDKLEKLQERTLCFIFSDYTSPYGELLKHGHFLSLFALRIRYLAIEMYKCVHGLNPPYLNELFKNKDTRYHFRDSNRLQQPEFQTVRYGFKSFRYYGSKLWNALPAEVKKKTFTPFQEKCYSMVRIS